MAARRLLVVLVILLVFSTIAAALAPLPEPPSERETAANEVTGEAQSSDGRLVRKTLDVQRKRPSTVRLALGDLLALRVPVLRPAAIEIPALGELESAAPFSPATFDLLPFEEGTYLVRLLRTDRQASARTIGQIIVTKRHDQPRRATSEPSRRAGRSAGTSRSR